MGKVRYWVVRLFSIRMRLSKNFTATDPTAIELRATMLKVLNRSIEARFLIEDHVFFGDWLPGPSFGDKYLILVKYLGCLADLSYLTFHYPRASD